MVDGGHVRLVVALAGGRGEVVQACDLLDAQLNGVGCGVLFDAGDAFGAGDRGDVVALGEQPGQSDLCRGGVDLGRDGLDLVDDAEVLFEVGLGEARVVLAPVVAGEVEQVGTFGTDPRSTPHRHRSLWPGYSHRATTSPQPPAPNASPASKRTPQPTMSS